MATSRDEQPRLAGEKPIIQGLILWRGPPRGRGELLGPRCQGGSEAQAARLWRTPARSLPQGCPRRWLPRRGTPSAAAHLTRVPRWALSRPDPDCAASTAAGRE